jgi:hypothetical protein
MMHFELEMCWFWEFILFLFYMMVHLESKTVYPVLTYILWCIDKILSQNTYGDTETMQKNC